MGGCGEGVWGSLKPKEKIPLMGFRMLEKGLRPANRERGEVEVGGGGGGNRGGSGGRFRVSFRRSETCGLSGLFPIRFGLAEGPFKKGDLLGPFSNRGYLLGPELNFGFLVAMWIGLGLGLRIIGVGVGLPPE